MAHMTCADVNSCSVSYKLAQHSVLYQVLSTLSMANCMAVACCATAVWAALQCHHSFYQVFLPDCRSFQVMHMIQRHMYGICSASKVHANTTSVTEPKTEPKSSIGSPPDPAHLPATTPASSLPHQAASAHAPCTIPNPPPAPSRILPSAPVPTALPQCPPAATSHPRASFVLNESAGKTPGFTTAAAARAAACQGLKSILKPTQDSQMQPEHGAKAQVTFADTTKQHDGKRMRQWTQQAASGVGEAQPDR